MLPGLNGGQSSYGVVLGQGGIPEGQSQQDHMQNLMTWRNQVQMAAMRGDSARYQQLLGSAPSGAQVVDMGGPTGPQTTLGGMQASGAPTTLGQLAGGNLGGGNAPPSASGGNVGISANGNTAMANTGVGSIPGTQPNYPLDIGSYLNPMIGYQLQQGMNTIDNSAAAAGNLNSGNTLKSLLNYGMGVGADSYNNAANIAAGQQNFGYGVDNNDRNFAYNAANNDRNFAYQAQTGDRDFNFNRDATMANIGLNGANQQSTNDRLLSTLLSNNLTTLGQTQGTGTIGQNNSLQSIITRLLGQLGGNQAVGIAGG
jgi:hypothetical protein